MEFNFLRGGEPYKRRWGTVDGAVYRLQILPQESAESGQAA
jgi:CelD/BcsL family acetyltransferase involved in cellulose biosynthesis